VFPRHVCLAKLDEVSLFSDSSLLSPSSASTSAAAQAAAGGIDAVELKSKVRREALLGPSGSIMTT
jgi:hypothetical protein